MLTGLGGEVFSLEVWLKHFEMTKTFLKLKTVLHKTVLFNFFLHILVIEIVVL